MNNLKEEIRGLIKEDRINTAILKLREQIQDSKLINELVALEARYNRLVAVDLSNIEKFDDLDRHYSKITRTLLSIVDKIDESRVLPKSDQEHLISSKNEIALLLKENRRLKNQLDKSLGIIKGKRLFQYEGLYPIDLAPETDIPSLNKDLFKKAIDHFLKDEIYDRLAASDIVYLRKDNLDHQDDILDDDYIHLYARLVEKYDLYEFIENFKSENDKVLGNYIRIINEFGITLKDCYLEILLHNVRNPLKSVIAAQNTEGISTRKLFDPSTRFVVEYVRHQGRHLIKAFEGKGKISYEKVFKNGKIVKATTTPVFDNRYGLVGIICINIDIAAVKGADREAFINTYCKLLTTDEKTLRHIQ